MSLIRLIFLKHTEQKSSNTLLYTSTLGCRTKSIGLDLTSKALDSVLIFLFFILVLVFYSRLCAVSQLLPASARSMCAVMPPVKQLTSYQLSAHL